MYVRLFYFPFVDVSSYINSINVLIQYKVYYLSSLCQNAANIRNHSNPVSQPYMIPFSFIPDISVYQSSFNVLKHDLLPICFRQSKIV